MNSIPKYVGQLAYGLKMGVVLPGMDIAGEILSALEQCHRDGYLHTGDVICVTESIVARAENNYVSLDRIAGEIREKLSLQEDGHVAVVFPIASRNRFSMILQGIARSVPRGSVTVQLSFPTDEVGNLVIDPAFAAGVGGDQITEEDLKGRSFCHPVTGVDYIALYRQIISSEGARARIILSNDPCRAIAAEPDGVIAADIHTREKTRAAIQREFSNCICLDQVCSSGEQRSEFGLLGSNMSSGERLKLAPRDSRDFVFQLQARIKDKLGTAVEVIVYGDGAYLDPTSGIYELADPRAAFAATGGLQRNREGLKYKYLADRSYHEDNKSAAEIEALIDAERGRAVEESSLEKEGTTPRPLEDLLASLADLVSGSADAGTPVVVIKGFLGDGYAGS